MRLDGAVSSQMKGQSRLPDIVLFQGETVLNEGRDRLTFKVLSNLLCVLPDGRVWRIEGHGVVEHELKVDKKSVGIDVGLLEDTVLDVAQTDGLLDHLIVLGHLAAVRERVKVLDDGIAPGTDDAAKIVYELAKGGFETLATLPGALATIENAALCELG